MSPPARRHGGTERTRCPERRRARWCGWGQGRNRGIGRTLCPGRRRAGRRITLRHGAGAASGPPPIALSPPYLSKRSPCRGILVRSKCFGSVGSDQRSRSRIRFTSNCGPIDAPQRSMRLRRSRRQHDLSGRHKYKAAARFRRRLVSRSPLPRRPEGPADRTWCRAECFP
jgi:hypothetical protein